MRVIMIQGEIDDDRAEEMRPDLDYVLREAGVHNATIRIGNPTTRWSETASNLIADEYETLKQESLTRQRRTDS